LLRPAESPQGLSETWAGARRRICRSAAPANSSLIAPPGYRLEGIDLVTEGAVTLNQLFSILDADPDHFEPDSSVTRLYDAISSADRINFIVGGSSNLGHADIAFKQQGIMPRHKAIELLAQKLRSEGRLVDIKQV